MFALQHVSVLLFVCTCVYNLWKRKNFLTSYRTVCNHGNHDIMIITGAGVTGHIMVVVLFLMVTSSLEFIR